MRTLTPTSLLIYSALFSSISVSLTLRVDMQMLRCLNCQNAQKCTCGSLHSPVNLEESCPLFVLFCIFCLCCSMCCLCVNVYYCHPVSTQLQKIYHIISYHIISYRIIFHSISYHIIPYNIISYHIIHLIICCHFEMRFTLL